MASELVRWVARCFVRALASRGCSGALGTDQKGDPGRAAGWLARRWREILPSGLGHQGKRSKPPAVVRTFIALSTWRSLNPSAHPEWRWAFACKMGRSLFRAALQPNHLKPTPKTNRTATLPPKQPRLNPGRCWKSAQGCPGPEKAARSPERAAPTELATMKTRLAL